MIRYLFLPLFFVAACKSSLPKEREFTVTINQISKTYNTADKDHFNELKVIEKKDPNSGDTLKYHGFSLPDFLGKILPKNRKLKEVHSVDVIAKDGYLMNLPKGILLDSKNFVTLKVENAPPKGLYNKLLKNYFDWKPIYILLAPTTKHSLSSPYQVNKIIFNTTKVALDLRSSIPGLDQKSSALLQKSCLKCHSLHSQGGFKAPPLKAVLIRYKNNEKLKKLLKDPQGTAKRQIEMSPFKGSQKDLNDLIKALNIIREAP